MKRKMHNTDQIFTADGKLVISAETNQQMNELCPDFEKTKEYYIEQYKKEYNILKSGRDNDLVID